jgi:hypothetical protein
MLATADKAYTPVAFHQNPHPATPAVLLAFINTSTQLQKPNNCYLPVSC